MELILATTVVGRPPGIGHLAGCAVLTVLAAVASPLHAQNVDPIDRDTGNGIPMSMFGTYVEEGQLLVYPFAEYYRDSQSEYQPSELGYVGDADYFGSYEALEGLIFLGYGISNRWAVEFEAAVISARQERDPTDPGDFPQELKQSGLGDVEGQLRYMWRRQTAERGGVFSYFETVLPIQKKKRLIGTPNWEFKFGTGYIRSYTWGTMTYRASVAYDKGPELGEYAVEYARQ
ncbi:MAG: hypothetical protein KJO65_03290, partial [Gemmatimonadetes bacterium]|nr:hypothetical protein [Gemmatimonadota bacterium]